MNEDLKKDLPPSSARPSASSADSKRWSAASAGLADHPSLARTSSSASSASSRLSRLSFASSSAGNRESVISYEEAAANGSMLEALPEIPTAKRRTGSYGEGDAVNPIPEEGNSSFSQQCPHHTSSLRAKEKLDYLMEKTYCCHKEMEIPNMSTIMSHTRPYFIHGPPFIIPEMGYKLCLIVKVHSEAIDVGLRIMKGTNDKDLQWPFNMTVLFRLKNLSGGLDREKLFHCCDGFRLKDCLSRPTKSDMNVAIGFSGFASRNSLLKDGFIGNNLMLLECYLFPNDSKVNGTPEVPVTIQS